MEIDDILDTALYADILSKKPCRELELSLATELLDAYSSYEGGWPWGWYKELDDAFEWSETSQGHHFWSSISHNDKPKGYR